MEQGYVSVFLPVFLWNIPSIRGKCILFAPSDISLCVDLSFDRLQQSFLPSTEKHFSLCTMLFTLFLHFSAYWTGYFTSACKYDWVLSCAHSHYALLWVHKLVFIWLNDFAFLLIYPITPNLDQYVEIRNNFIRLTGWQKYVDYSNAMFIVFGNCFLLLEPHLTEGSIFLIAVWKFLCIDLQWRCFLNVISVAVVCKMINTCWRNVPECFQEFSQVWKLKITVVGLDLI